MKKETRGRNRTSKHKLNKMNMYFEMILHNDKKALSCGEIAKSLKVSTAIVSRYFTDYLKTRKNKKS